MMAMDNQTMVTKRERQGAGRGKGRRGPRRASAKHLERAALYYLERYATSSDNLRRVLMRKVARSARAHDTDETAGRAMVEELIARFLELGLLDDARYAESQVRRLRRRGTSRRLIMARLWAKGLDATVIDEALRQFDDLSSEPEMAAACAYVQRRRLGPYRAARARERLRGRDLAALARAGFSYRVAERVMATADIKEIEALRADTRE
jgi:regulatory protein